MRWIKYFEGHLDDSLYMKITQEEAENSLRESSRREIKSPIDREDYERVHKIVYMLFDICPNIHKIDGETKDDFKIEAKINADDIYGDGDPTIVSLTKPIKKLLDDGRIYFHIQMKNPHGYHDLNLYKIRGDVWILMLENIYYQMEGLEGFEDMVKNREIVL